MAKEFEDKFFDELRSGVVDSTPAKTSFEERREMLKKSIQDLESNVIKDPKTLEKLKRELASVDKEIKKQDAEKNIDKAVKDKEETEQEVKQEGKLEEKEQSEHQLENVEQLKQVYYDSMVALHEKRMQTLKKQKSSVPMELVSNDSDYEQELKLESKVYNARDSYMKLGKDDPYTEKRTELIKKEKEAREPIERELRNRAKRFREIEQKLKELNEREEEINKELLSRDITETQIKTLNNELEEMGEKRKNLELERANIKAGLDKAIDIRRQRTIKRAGIEKKYVETLSDKDKKNYNYQQSKISTMNRNFDVATKQHYENIKTRIEEREQKIKDINKELNDVSDTDFERRLLLLNELDKENTMLEADVQAKDDLDRGFVPDVQEMRQEVYEKEAEEDHRQKEFDKSTEEVREVIEEQKEKVGKAVVEAPSIANAEEKDRETTMKAAVVAAVYDNPEPGKDTLVQDYGQFVKAKCVIEGLEDKVRDPNNPDDAKAMIENDEQLSKADTELERIEDQLTK